MAHMLSPFDFAGSRRDWIDEGKKRFLASAYLLMAGGVMVSAGAAWLVAGNAGMRDALFTADGFTPLGWIVTLAPLAIVLLFRQALMRLSANAARALFLVYTALVGASLASIVTLYTGASIAGTFAGVAIGFGILSFVAGHLKADLTRTTRFMTFTLFGLLAAMLINFVLRSSDLDFTLALLIVLFFSFGTMVDTQRLEALYGAEADAGVQEKGAIMGALMLYLDLLNPFIAMVRLVGRRR